MIRLLGRDELKQACRAHGLDDSSEYTQLMRPERGRGKLVFINLQKRVLSSIAAFGCALPPSTRAPGACTMALRWPA